MQKERDKRTSQIRLFYAMLTNSGLLELKEDIVSSFTNGRTVHVTELSDVELQKLCSTMRERGFPTTQKETQEYRLRRKIYALCFDIGIIYGQSPEDWQMNYAKVDAFCISRGTVKKGLREQGAGELKKTLRQFSAIAAKAQAVKEREQTIAMLEREFNEAIRTENFELCDTLREQIEQHKTKHKTRKK